MQSCRSTSSTLPRIKISFKPKTTTAPTATMAFLPRELYGANSGFTPLFRLLDDFDTYSKQAQPHRGHRNHVPTFQPKFDVREVEDAYELHGELAGMNKKDVHIEFTDPQTVVVRGRIERSYQAGTPPAGLVEGNTTAAAIESGEHSPTRKERQATVEDEADDGSHTPTTTVAELEKAEPERAAKPADKARYWVSERSIGEFSRTFSFPVRVDQEAVTAKLEDGVLSVRVPKAPKHEARRIDIV